MTPLVTALGLVFAVAFSATAATGTGSGIYGVVTRSPITPVCTREEPCSAPAKGVTLVFSVGGRSAARVTTDARGRYRLGLLPGRYAVALAIRRRIGGGLQPQRVVVPAGPYARVDFSIDTGIR
jgi:hypothetical protein